MYILNGNFFTVIKDIHIIMNREDASPVLGRKMRIKRKGVVIVDIPSKKQLLGLNHPFFSLEQLKNYYSNIPWIKYNTFSDIFEDALFHLSGQLNLNHIEVRRSFCRENRPIVLDRDRLYEVILNVLLNAIQAISKKGEIAISTKIVSSEAGKDDSEQLLISVADTGIGIDKTLRDQVFKPYHTNRKGGTGLGLSICRKNVDQHGGRMELTGDKGQGTTVNIYLPIVDDEG